MRRWRKKFGRLGGTGAAITAAAATAGTLLWRRSTADLVEDLVHPEGPVRPEAVSFDQLHELPEAVARYFHFALQEGEPTIRRCRVAQRGVIRLDLHSPWRPYRALQLFTTSPRGFVWDARVRMAPLITARVRNSYVRGRAGMVGRLASVVPLASRGDTPELASGMLHRWLAEAVWFPTALLPSEGVLWTGLDDDTSRATITDGGITVSLDFTFGDDGRVERAYTPVRYREVDGSRIATPWACHYHGYESIGGIRVPTAGSAVWLLPKGELTYWRGRLLDVSFTS